MSIKKLLDGRNMGCPLYVPLDVGGVRLLDEVGEVEVKGVIHAPRCARRVHGSRFNAAYFLSQRAKAWTSGRREKGA